ncbi:MAG TPA: nitrilase-related carbon-nitrogen hydrolase, partial [Ignavibacteriaceae bacterium]|nr:nitrilase-related carbon-nitrogen hydrolase [Ignavibacteriaceae bacterium]
MLFSNGRWIVPLAAWIFPIFFIRFLRTQKLIPGFIFLSIISALVNMIIWWKMIPFPIALYFFMMGLMGIIFSLSFLADRLLSTHLKGFATTLVFPASWCTIDYLLTLTSKGTWLSLAYTQSDNLPLLQLTSVTGISGIVFLITWFASFCIWLLEQNFEWKYISKGIYVYTSVMGAILLFGIIRLNFFSTNGNTVRIASIVQKRELNDDLSSCKWTDAKGIGKFSTELENNLLEKSKESAQSGAKIVLWQEAAGFIPKQEEEDFIKRAMKLAAQEKIYLLMTLWSVPENFPKNKVENKLIIINPEGIQKVNYIKNNPAPPEPILKGDGTIPVLQTIYGKIAPAICADGDYAGFIRQAGQNKADILFLPANDWKAIDPIHTYMAIMRAIENGFSIVHPAGQGLSVAADNLGRIISSMDFYTTSEQVMYSDVPIRGSRTIYALIGDAFAWLCIAGFTAVTASVIFRKNFKGRMEKVKKRG